MALETKHYINGIEVRPVNADSIGFEMDWTGDILEAELNTDSIVLATEARALVLNHINTLGVFEGVPYRVEIGTTVLDYYIDLTDSPLISGEGDSTIEVKIKRRKALDYFKQQADGLIWELVNKTLGINTVEIPYLIVRDNQLELFIMLSITTYQLNKAIYEAVRDVVDAITEVVRATTPNAGISPSLDTGDIISVVLLAVARTIYTAALLIALIQVTKQIIELVFPPLKKFKGVTVQELLQKGAQYLGYNFNTTVTEFSNMTVLPKPILCPKEGIFKTLFTFDSGLRTKGYPTGIGGDSVGTFGQLLDFCKDWCNGKLRIQGNDVFLERRDFWNANAGVQIHNTLNLQDKRENQWTYNTGEAWKRYYIKYQLDALDVHTYDNVEGVYSEHQTDPLAVTNPDLVLIKGLARFEFPFALGQRKESLTFIEQLFLPFATLADTVINLFGGSSNLAASITGRVGVLVISSQFFGVTKLLYTVNGRQPVNFRDLIGAEQAYQKYHEINQVKENFKRIYRATIPFSTANFEQLLENNYVNDQDGTPLEVLNLEWTNQSKTAQIEYAILSGEGFNTETILIEGGGTSGTTTTQLTC